MIVIAWRSVGDILIPDSSYEIQDNVWCFFLVSCESIKLSHFSLQGFNRIVAIALLFMHEEDAFWLLVYIVEHLMPPEYYSRDRQLIGCQVSAMPLLRCCSLLYCQYCATLSKTLTIIILLPSRWTRRY